jgi:hypothetical protein
MYGLIWTIDSREMHCGYSINAEVNFGRSKNGGKEKGKKG